MYSTVNTNRDTKALTSEGDPALRVLIGNQPIVLPWDCELVEVSFSNAITAIDGKIDFYKNGTATFYLISRDDI